MNPDYAEFLARKAHLESSSGFEPVYMPDALFPFQAALVEWAVRKGRGAMFAGCGLGKTAMQLAWAENVVRHTGGRVLILTPLAVARQTVKEGEKFGIHCEKSNGEKTDAAITVTNYEKLHHFDAADYIGVVGDESGILKNFKGATKYSVTQFMKKTPYRLLCSATPSPNDFIEIGTHSEALGYLGYMDMLGRFFKNDQGSNHPNRNWTGGKDWRFRGHAENDFWRWVCSWARAVQKPSDLGDYDDSTFTLPPLVTREHVVSAREKNPDFLFDIPAVTLLEQRDERKRSVRERCEMAAEICHGHGEQSVAWCYLNSEGALLSELCPGAVEVKGGDPDEMKEESFSAFESGEIQTIVSKPTIAGFGLNWQHCNRMTFFPSHSYEQWHQAIRRCWRFGQKRAVEVDLISSEGESGVLRNMRSKMEKAEVMFASIVALMGDELHIRKSSEFKLKEEIPSWLS